MILLVEEIQPEKPVEGTGSQFIPLFYKAENTSQVVVIAGFLTSTILLSMMYSETSEALTADNHFRTNGKLVV